MVASCERPNSVFYRRVAVVSESLSFDADAIFRDLARCASLMMLTDSNFSCKLELKDRATCVMELAGLERYLASENSLAE